MSNNNSLFDVGVASGQMKTSFSFLEKTQIDSLSSTTGSIQSRAGTINGDISTAIKNTNNTIKSRMEMGFTVADRLQSSGITVKNTANIISNNVIPAINNRQDINRSLASAPINAANIYNRLPPSNKFRPDQKIKSVKESILGKEDYNYEGNHFPSDLEKTADLFMRLKFETYTRANPQAEGEIKPSQNFYLPLPDNLAQAFEVLYDQRDTGIMGEFIKSQTGQSVLSSQQNGLSLQNATDVIRNVTKGETKNALESIAKRGIYTALSSADESLGGLAGQIAGEIPNPHPTVFFKGMNLRTFSFTWRLIPLNQEDAVNLKRIIDEMKRKILPKSTGTILRYPDFVTPIPAGGAAEKIGKYKRCLVRSLSINYTGEGVSAFYYDGHPVSIILTMDFQEVENFTSEDV
jgi:hypothetical protein